jgi:DNA mismatch endonuclease (patch repair protein)
MANLVTDPGHRSDLMSRIRSKNTKPELLVFRYLRKRGIYFQRHYSRVIGNPDIALPRKRIAIFIDGDFWHGRQLDRVIRKHGPDSTWATRLSRNVERDLAVRLELEDSGWRVLRVWESDLMRKSTQATALLAIEHFLSESREGSRPVRD